MPATIDTIADLVKAALEVQGFVTSVGAIVATMSLPNFDQVEAGESILIKIAGYEVLDIQHHDRAGVVENQKIGIGIFKTLTRDADGQLNEADFRAMKSLAESVRRWAWTGISEYECKMSGPANGAMYDGPQARAGKFLYVNDVTYFAEFEL